VEPSHATVQAFLDGLIAAQLEAYQLPGAAVAVVQEGELLFAKGYGYADLASRCSLAVSTAMLFHPF